MNVKNSKTKIDTSSRDYKEAKAAAKLIHATTLGALRDLEKSKKLREELDKKEFYYFLFREIRKFINKYGYDHDPSIDKTEEILYKHNLYPYNPDIDYSKYKAETFIDEFLKGEEQNRDLTTKEKEIQKAVKKFFIDATMDEEPTEELANKFISKHKINDNFNVKDHIDKIEATLEPREKNTNYSCGFHVSTNKFLESIGITESKIKADIEYINRIANEALNSLEFVRQLCRKSGDGH